MTKLVPGDYCSSPQPMSERDSGDGQDGDPGHPKDASAPLPLPHLSASFYACYSRIIVVNLEITII